MSLRPEHRLAVRICSLKPSLTTDIAETLVDLAKLWHQTPLRGFVTWARCLRTISAAFDIQEEPQLEPILALLWKNACYLPPVDLVKLAVSDGQQAGLSALAFVHAVKYCGRTIGGDSIWDLSITRAFQRTKNLIECYGTIGTRAFATVGLSEDSLSTPSAIMADADMAFLAEDWDTFCESMNARVSEALVVGSPETVRATLAEQLANQLLTRGQGLYLYNTGAGRQLWEEKARDNLLRFSKKYRR